MNAQRCLRELEMNVAILTKKYKLEVSKLNSQYLIDHDIHFVAPLIRAMEELLKEYVARYDQHRKEINNLEKQIIELKKPIKTTDELVDGFNKELTELKEQNENLQARLLDLENKITNKDMTLCRLDRENQELVRLRELHKKAIAKNQKIWEEEKQQLTTTITNQRYRIRELEQQLVDLKNQLTKPITREMLEKIQQEHSHKFDNLPPEPCPFSDEELVGEPMNNHAEFMQQVIEEMESPETIAQFAPIMNEKPPQIVLTTSEKQQFSTGAVRSKDANSTRYDLISPVGLRRIAETYAEGAAKYGDNNWQKGMPASDTMNHALRHLNLWLSGDKTEDHLAHAAWNLIAIMHFEELKPDCIDVPTRRTA
jgi:hypothetical protein